jgi:aconitate hydratase
VLPLNFVNPADYDKVKDGDKVSLLGLSKLAPGQTVECVLKHADGSQDKIELKHSLTEEQITWFKAGSALAANKK